MCNPFRPTVPGWQDSRSVLNPARHLILPCVFDEEVSVSEKAGVEIDSGSDIFLFQNLFCKAGEKGRSQKAFFHLRTDVMG